MKRTVLMLSLVALMLAACTATSPSTSKQATATPVPTAASGDLGVFLAEAVYPPATPGQGSGIPSSSKLAALRAGDGAQVWNKTMTQLVLFGPIVADGMVYGTLATVPSGTTVLGQTTLAAFRTSDGGQAWTKSTPAPMLAVTVAAANGALYAVTAPSQGAATDTPLVALRASDGSQLWTADLGGVLQGGPNQPIVESNGILYLTVASPPQSGGSGPESRIVALRASDGKQQWSVSLSSILSPLLFNGQSALVVSGDTVYLAADYTTPTSSNIPEIPTVLALRASDGTKLWTHQFTSPLPSGQISLVAGGSGVYAAVALQPTGPGSTSGGMLVGLNPQSGAQQWNTPLSGTALSLVAGSGAVYAATFLLGETSPGAIAAFNASDGKQIWSQPVQSVPSGGATLLGSARGSVFASVAGPPAQGAVAASTTVEALSAADGSQQWKVEADGLTRATVAPF